MFRLAIFTVILLSGAIATTAANAQTTPENAKQSSDDSDLFALPKNPSLAEAMATVDERLATATERADAAEKRADAAEKEAEVAKKEAEVAKKEAQAAKAIADATEDLSND